MKNVLLFAYILIASGLLLTNVYTTMVDSKSWGSNIPRSIEVAREYFKVVNPGNFFRVFAPIGQLLGLVVLILFWKSSPSIRLYLGIAFLLFVFADVLTFAYFYPRNDILFKTGDLADVEMLKRVWSEWRAMNWVRTLVVIIGLIFTFLSLHKIYTLK